MPLRKQRRLTRKSQGTKSLANLRNRTRRFEPLEARELLAITTFQDGVGGYAGTQDTVIFSVEPDVNAGTSGIVGPDQQDLNGVRQGLLRFDNIIGPTAIPRGAKINSAELIVNVNDSSNSAMQMSLYRMQVDWNEATATWNSFGAIGGVQTSEGESSDLPPDAVLLDPNVTGVTPTAGRFDVKRSLEYWAAGVDNFGWLIESASTNGWDIRSKESPVAQRPRLVVDWEVPATNQYQIVNTNFNQPEGNSLTTTALVDVARLGNLSNATSIAYSISAGTAQGSDFVAVANGTLSFAANQSLATIPVTINGDTELEGLETVIVTLTSGNVVSGRDTATVTIADDDLLINEVLANVTNASDETNREYIELIGTPNASLNGYYFVVFEGDERGDAGATADGSSAGLADYVFNLSGLTLGSNGLLVLAPTNWEYQSLAASGTNVVNTLSLDGVGGILEDRSQTYALIRSPSAPMVQGADYDTVGTYENASAVAIGVGVGVLDQLPAGADVVDSVGIVQGGGSNRDRTLAPQPLGHPGVHIHQPTPVTPGGNVASDALSRRVGENLPNTIGVWYNGDISDGSSATGLSYLNDSYFISVVSPDGSRLTPGSPNLLRNVFFRVSDQDKEVAEADGSVTLRIERTGDLSEVISVTYQTVDFGSAQPGQDFTAVTETFEFGVGQSFRDVTISILPDMVAEGFEEFIVRITAATGGYKITDGRSNLPLGAVNGEAVVTIADANVLAKSFKNGVNGYNGNKDGYLDGEFVNDKFGQDLAVRVDRVKGGTVVGGPVRPQQGLIRFDNLFGNGADQIPPGSTIFSAFLTVNVQNVAASTDNIWFMRMLQDWEQVNASWTDPQGNAGNGIVNGVTPDDVEAAAVPDFKVPDPGRAGLLTIPLNADTIQDWANGSSPNYGWSIISESSALWAFNSSESFLIGTAKPELTILYTDPEPVNNGVFSLDRDEVLVSESGTATFTVNRVGGNSGATSVNWQIAPASGDTGSLSDLSGSTSGTISFADGELFDTLSININNDNLLERDETLTLTLSGPGLSFARNESQLTIRDNDFNPLGSDLLLNEMFINSPGLDIGHEFVELKGAPGIGLGSLFYVAIEGTAGDRVGSAEKVANLGAFQNGVARVDGRGYSVLTTEASGFNLQVPVEATHIDRLGTAATEVVSTGNNSTTYLLLYSPLSRLTEIEFDYDWDDDGALELPLGVQIVDSLGIRVLGGGDQLYGPAANEVIVPPGGDPEIDAITRSLTNNERSRGNAWFGGNLRSAGDDYLNYDPVISFGLPVTGAAVAPGDPNVGTNVQSPLVALQNVTVNANGTVTATFSGRVSQVSVGDGTVNPATGEGITITDPSGVPLPTVDARPVISGFGTNTLTLAFTGSGVTGGQLPAGDYRLNFVGNGIIANGRVVDVANNGTAINGFFSQAFTVSSGPSGDFFPDGVWDCADVNLLTTAIATGSTNLQFDMNGDGQVTLLDVTAPITGWLAVGGANNVPLTGGNPFREGDANLDGVVDGQDFIVWNSNKFTANTNWCDGNFNGDSVVDGQDFIVWNQNKFTSSALVRPLAGDLEVGVEHGKLSGLPADKAMQSRELQVTAPQVPQLTAYQRTATSIDAHRAVDEVEHESLIDEIFAESA